EQVGGAAVQLPQNQVTFPGLKNDLNAPTKPINGLEGFGGPNGASYIGHKDIPAQQVELARAGVQAAVPVDFGLAPPLIGQSYWHRLGHQAHAKFLSSQQHFPVKGLAGSQKSLQV